MTQGTHTVKVALRSAGKRARKHHKKTKVTVGLEGSLTSVSASRRVEL